jgi:hypothetical protein
VFPAHAEEGKFGTLNGTKVPGFSKPLSIPITAASFASRVIGRSSLGA